MNSERSLQEECVRATNWCVLHGYCTIEKGGSVVLFAKFQSHFSNIILKATWVRHSCDSLKSIVHWMRVRVCYKWPPSDVVCPNWCRVWVVALVQTMALWTWVLRRQWRIVVPHLSTMLSRPPTMPHLTMRSSQQQALWWKRWRREGSNWPFLCSHKW